MTLGEPPSHLSSEVYSKVVVTKPEDYADAYPAFLQTTNEKQVIASALGPLLLPGTILDIGAGTGDIPDLLHVDRERYTALEQRPEFVELLRQKGYTVIDILFPCELPEKYSNALLCYVLYSLEQSAAMIDPAWETVADQGQLATVTFRDNPDDYNTLLHRIGHVRRVNDDRRHNWLTQKFSSLGRTAVHTVQSYVYSDTVEGLAGSLSFMATNSPVGTVEIRQDLQQRMIAEREYIDERYREPSGTYRFPIDHYIFTTMKEA